MDKDKKQLIREYEWLWRLADKVDEQTDMLGELASMIDVRLRKAERLLPKDYKHPDILRFERSLQRKDTRKKR